MQNDGLTLQTVVLHWNIERRRNNCTVLIRDVKAGAFLNKWVSQDLKARRRKPQKTVRWTVF